MNFKSVTGLGLAADGLIRQYFHFAGDSGMLEQTTDTRNSPKLVIEIRALRTHVVGYRDRARAIVSDPNFSTLDANVRDDVTAIAEEADLALQAIDGIADHEKVWTKLLPEQRKDLTQRVTVDELELRTIRSRLRHELRGPGGDPGTPVPPATPPREPSVPN